VNRLGIGLARAEELHLAGRILCIFDLQLFPQGLCHELLERLALLGRLCLRLAEQQVEDFKRRLNAGSEPYLRLTCKTFLAPQNNSAEK
jgi:hypothetical protein